jgi:hypothetical protein
MAVDGVALPRADSLVRDFAAALFGGRPEIR